jgi:hypothetical protein
MVRASAAVAVLVLAGAAAGCGSSSSGSASSSSASAKSTGQGSPASAGQGSSASGSQAVNPNGPEVSPSGDIPDNQAYVLYRPPGGGYGVKVPEGWARVVSGNAVTFSDKLNSVRMETLPGRSAPSVSSVRKTDLPKLAQAVPGFKARTVDTVQRKAGTAVHITYLADSKPNDVTGKVVRDAVERYVFSHNGKTVALTLSGPKGADNVDPWRIVSDSLRWTR